MNALDRALDPVVTKARGHLRTSTLLLTGALVLSALLLVVFQEQAASRRANFDENSNLQLVRVSHHEDDPLSPLTTGDATAIGRLSPSGSATSPLLSLGVGLTTDGGETVTIYGISAELAPVIGVEAMEDAVAYTSNPDRAGRIRLGIPVVRHTEGGAESNRLAHTSLTFSPTADAAKIAYLNGSRTADFAYVTERTFWYIARRMLEDDRASIERRHADGELSMIPLVGSVLVHVPDIDRVRAVAGEIEDEGYAVSYALQAFDEVEKSLSRDRLIGGAVAGVVLVGVGVYFLLTWRSYLALSRRDIGILRHWQVPARTIDRLYGRRLTRSLVVPFAVAASVAAVAAFMLLGWRDALVPIAVDVGALLVILLLLHQVVRRVLIPNWTRRDVLVLLRADREFQ